MTKIFPIQMLRAVAALGIVVGHAIYGARQSALEAGLDLEPFQRFAWNAGVDLFFVVSGFIIVYASEDLFAAPRAGRTFLWRRITRLVPLYWLVLTAYLFVILASRQFPGRRDAFDTAAVVASFLFMPYDTFGDGVMRPFYTLGWTLNYEMLFYALFALYAHLRREWAVACVGLTLATLAVCGRLVALPGPLAFWSAPIVLEFVLGMGVAVVFRRGWTLPQPGALLIGAAATLVLVDNPLFSPGRSPDWAMPSDVRRVLAWGVPSASLVAAAVLGRSRTQAPGPLARSLGSIGDASYALYLCHPIVLALTWVMAGRIGLFALVGAAPVIVAAVFASCLFAVGVHHLIERPLVRKARATLVALADRSPIGRAPTDRAATDLAVGAAEGTCATIDRTAARERLVRHG